MDATTNKQVKKTSPTEKILRKTITYEVSEKPLVPGRTKPKRGRFISQHRALDFMQHLWEARFRECTYKALKLQFITFFGTNENRVIEKYLGRPEETVRYPGSSIVRLNRNSGKLAHFQYTNRRVKPAKIGLMEILGYLTLDKKTKHITLHHEGMKYYTEQTELSLKKSSPNPIFKNVNESSTCKSDGVDLCVQPIEVEKSKVLGVGDVGSIEVEKKEEEEAIDYTHKSSRDTKQFSDNLTNSEVHLIPFFKYLSLTQV